MSRPPVLTSSAGAGGVVAVGGFDYQFHYGVVKIAEWLADPTFEGVMFEALEDVEARFFAPQAPKQHLLIRIQAKSGEMDRGAILAVLDNFVDFESHFPGIAKRFELVTPQLPAKMAWIVKDLERVRFAGPFYAPFREVREASDRVVQDHLVSDLGVERGELLFKRGEVVLVPAVNAHGFYGLFIDALTTTYPDLQPKRPLFDELVRVARASTKTFLSRASILAVLENDLGKSLPQTTSILHILGDRPGPVSNSAVRLDVAHLSGKGRLSPPDVYEEGLIDPLRALKEWWQKQGVRRIAIEGNYRLSSAFSIGAVLNASAGLDLDIQTKDGVWRTDDHDNAATVAPIWATSSATRSDGGLLNLAIGVLRDPLEVLIAKGVDQATIARAFLDEAVTSGRQLQALVANLKRFIGSEVTRLGASGVNLYYVGPAALATALGHRWNALAPVQVFEFDAATGAYFPTAHLR